MQLLCTHAVDDVVGLRGDDVAALLQCLLTLPHELEDGLASVWLAEDVSATASCGIHTLTLRGGN